MKEDKYIERVLSHITSKQRKNEIEPELFDHIDENEKFFTEIGYDETAASENADGKMGDADIVGEQLNSIKKRFKVNYYILSAIQIAAAIIYFIYAVWQDFENGSYSMPQFQFSYVDFTVYTIIILLSFICCCVGIKKKNLCSVVTGAIGSIIIINIKPYILQCELRDLFTDLNFWEFFYYSDPFALYSRSDGNIIISVILTLIVSAVSLTSIIIIIKTKLLKNTKRDIKRNKFALIMTILLITGTALLTANTVYQTVSVKNSLIEKTEQEIQTLNDIVINNAEEFMTVNPEELQAALDRHFESGDDGNYLYYGESEKYISDYSIRNNIAYAFVSVNSESTEITIDYSLINPLSLKDEAMPLGVNPVIYKYRADTDEYYIYTSFSGSSTDLSEKQSAQLQTALEEHFKDNEYLEEQESIHMRLDSYNATKYFLFTNILDVCKNPEYDSYRIDMTYCAYYPTLHMNEISDRKEQRGFCSVLVEFNDGKAEIIDCNEYYDAKDALACYSEKAAEAYSMLKDDEYYNAEKSNTDSTFIHYFDESPLPALF